jgi:hypothetical protein
VFLTHTRKLANTRHLQLQAVDLLGFGHNCSCGLHHVGSKERSALHHAIPSHLRLKAKLLDSIDEGVVGSEATTNDLTVGVLNAVEFRSALDVAENWFVHGVGVGEAHLGDPRLGGPHAQIVERDVWVGVHVVKDLVSRERNDKSAKEHWRKRVFGECAHAHLLDGTDLQPVHVLTAWVAREEARLQASEEVVAEAVKERNVLVAEPFIVPLRSAVVDSAEVGVVRDGLEVVGLLNEVMAS